MRKHYKISERQENGVYRVSYMNKTFSFEFDSIESAKEFIEEDIIKWNTPRELR
jgi:hypothetical protein